jgi:hypothetical protein
VFGFFNPINTGAFVGIAQGNFTIPSSTQVSTANTKVGALASDDNSALAPVKFISSYESYFLQAEAAARGWGAGNAKALFENGIAASFASYIGDIGDEGLILVDTPDGIGGVPLTEPIALDLNSALDVYMNGITTDSGQDYPAGYWAQFPTAGTVQQKVRHIITQKWFAMTGNQGFEAWNEWRRTGYPEFFTVSVESAIGKTKSILPRRFFYPDVEIQRNLSFPGQKAITDRVYWDIH